MYKSFIRTSWQLVFFLILFIMSIHCGLAQLQVGQANQRATLVLNDHQLPLGAQITDVEIDIAGAHVRALSGLPVGWSVLEISSSSVMSHVEIYSGSSGTVLSEEAFRLFTVEVSIPQAASTPIVSASGVFTILEKGGTKRHIPMSSYSFSFEDLYNRHRLPK